MPTLMKVLNAVLAIWGVIELVRGRSLVPWRRQEHPLRTRALALCLVLLVVSLVAGSELHAPILAIVLGGLVMVVALGAAIVGSREGPEESRRSSGPGSDTNLRT